MEEFSTTVIQIVTINHKCSIKIFILEKKYTQTLKILKNIHNSKNL